MTYTVYLYDPETRLPIGSYDCQESPLEPGEFITPLHSLPTAPPVPGEGEAVYYNGVDDWELINIPIPTAAQVLSSQLAAYGMAVRQHMSAIAKASPERFNSISEAKSFTGVDNPLRLVSEAFTVWAAEVQTSANTTLAAVEAGEIPLPSVDDLIASLPAWVHP